MNLLGIEDWAQSPIFVYIYYFIFKYYFFINKINLNLKLMK